jgi:Mannosyltransferase putative/Glycosyltransferase family 9 (heptosyltransferase)
MSPEKLVLKNGYSPGDVVMMTAAVRDLHLGYPGRFLTDVRTACPELWEHNPYLTPLSDREPGVQIIECSYPLIDQSNWRPYHCLHGFTEFLNDRLGLRIKPTAFKGDIHLSPLEQSWHSQVHELTGEDTPFWIVAAGGKYDISIKWWDAARYQRVIDHFRGKIQFVQVGAPGHHHPKLRGAIDLRGKTNLRELVRLVYHAQGVLCSITALMHLAAAIETKEGRPQKRPCVVVAGGREPVHWEAYPDHQFIHTNGALPCCQGGGCWRDRVFPLGDGDERDQSDHLCRNVVRGLPRCMDLISADEVIRRIQWYFQGGALTYLSPSQTKSARKAVARSSTKWFDREPLNLHSARMECERYIKALTEYPGRSQGQGIVMCAGGAKYFTCAWICLRMLRRLGCRLPVEIWHLGKREMDERMKEMVRPFGAECVDAFKVRKQNPVRLLGGWPLKAYAVLHCSFREILFLDADNVPVLNPEVLFRTRQFEETGAIFWPDIGRSEKADPIWRSCNLSRPAEPEFESGQIMLDKRRCWGALCLALWFNENADFYYRYLHGDKETFHLAFRKLDQSYSLVNHPIHPLAGTFCQHTFEGHRLFQHRNNAKWNLFGRNEPVADFWFEEECLEYLTELRSLWDGRPGSRKGGCRRFPVEAAA